jgi:drug/metabolite transporter (DMT)-like permease
MKVSEISSIVGPTFGESRQSPNIPSVKPGWTHAALLVVQVAFASQAVEGKIAMLPRAQGGEAIPPSALAMARMLGAALFFQAFTRIAGTLESTTRRDQVELALLSIVGISLNQTLFLMGLRLTTPVSAALLSVTIPVFTAFIAVAFRYERPTWRLFLGLGLALSGVVWLTGIRDLDRGAIIVTINSLSYSVYLVFSRKVVQRLGALTVITWIFTWGAALFAPLGVVALAETVPELTPRGGAFIAYILVMPTIVAYLANAWALGRSTASLVTIYIYLQPLLAGLLAWAQLGQTPSARIFTAAVFILAGVTIVATRKPPVPRFRSVVEGAGETG